MSIKSLQPKVNKMTRRRPYLPLKSSETVHVPDFYNNVFRVLIQS